jgi:hypothetical protein
MKKLCVFLACSYFVTLSAEDSTFSSDRLTDFYDNYACEEKSELTQVGLSSPCSPSSFNPNGPLAPLPTPPAPVSPPTPSPAPPAVSGLLPFVIVNNSGLPDSEVFVLIQGRVPVGGPQVFVDFPTNNGQGTLHQVVTGDNGSTYTKPLSSFPSSSGGHVFYLPYIDSFLVLVSLNTPLNIPVISGNLIQDPAFNDPNDPNGNFTYLWDQVEGAYLNKTQSGINVDATAVSFFSLPLYIYLSTPSAGSASNCGLTQPRHQIMSYMQSVFSTVPPTPERTQWQNLFMQNGSTVYRILSPGKAMAGGFFDVNYLDNASAYGYSYLSDIWTGPGSFYKSHPSSLSIQIPGGAIYSGSVQDDNSILFTSTGGNQVVFGAPTFGPPYTASTSFNIFSGLSLASSATIPADGIQVSKAFEEAIIAGIVPTTSLLNASTSNTLSVFRPYYQVNQNLSPHGRNVGPWYDLYSAGLHACGLIYTFGFDEPLWPEVLLQADTLQPNTFIGITIGPCFDF